MIFFIFFFFFQAEDGIRDHCVTGVQTCALPILLLDSSGHSVKLSALTRSKITLLTFFYTYCVDPLGCPFAHSTLAALRDRVRGDRALAKRVRFVSVSLDPTHDTPEVIVGYSKEFTIDPQFDWRFLTARRVPDLLPVLDDFG